MKGTAVSNGRSTRTDTAGADYAGLTRDDLLRAYRTMVLSRRIDDKEIQLKNQSLIFFQISGAGHEAILVAAGLDLRPGYDWFYPYYRDRALVPDAWRDAVRHVSVRRRRQATIRAPADGRCRRTGEHKRLNIVSQSSPTGTQCLQAIGCAEAASCCSTDHRHRGARGAVPARTRSCTCRSATARPAKGNSGSR